MYTDPCAARDLVFVAPMTRPQAFTVVFFGLLLFLLYQLALVFQPFLFPMLWAALLVHAPAKSVLLD